MPITPFGWRAAELFSICRYLDEAGGRLIVTLMEPYDITSIVYAARLGEVVTGSVEDGEVIRKLGEARHDGADLARRRREDGGSGSSCVAERHMICTDRNSQSGR